MSLARGFRTTIALFGRLEFWALFFTFLALPQLPAELYLASFGPPEIGDPWGRNLTTTAYEVRHLPMLLLFFIGAPVLLALMPVWSFLALTNGPRPARKISGRLVLISVIALSLVVAASWAASDVRRAGFQRAAGRMSPLVAAIRRFDAEMGRPPYDLAELTPRYLGSVHQFGVRGCRSLKYSYLPADAVGRWQLGLECPNGFNLDYFFFWPSGNYPTSRSVERMGEWAYRWD